MKNRALPFREFVNETGEEDIQKLRDLNLVPGGPIHKKIRDVQTQLQNDEEVANAIRQFNDVVEEVLKRTFTKEDQQKPEYWSFVRSMKTDTEDLRERTWLEWYWSH